MENYQLQEYIKHIKKTQEKHLNEFGISDVLNFGTAIGVGPCSSFSCTWFARL